VGADLIQNIAGGVHRDRAERRGKNRRCVLLQALGISEPTLGDLRCWSPTPLVVKRSPIAPCRLAASAMPSSPPPTPTPHATNPLTSMPAFPHAIVTCGLPHHPFHGDLRSDRRTKTCPPVFPGRFNSARPPHRRQVYASISSISFACRVKCLQAAERAFLFILPPPTVHSKESKAR